MTTHKISMIFMFCNIPLILSQCFESFSISNAITRNGRLVGNAFKNHTNVNTWVSCARLCLLRSLCKSFNYNEETQECEINWVSGIPSPTGEAYFWIYGEASEIPQSIVDGCAYHKCFDQQVCVNEADGGHSCPDIACCLVSAQNLHILSLRGVGGLEYLPVSIAKGRKVDGGHSCLDIDECTPVQSTGNINYTKVNGILELSCNTGLVGIGDPVANCVYTGDGFYWTFTFECYNTWVCYVLVNGVAMYTGTMSLTDTDKACDNWEDSEFTEVDLADLNVSMTTNYCRDVNQVGVPECSRDSGPGGPKLHSCPVPKC